MMVSTGTQTSRKLGENEMDKVFKYRDVKDKYTIKMLTDCELHFNNPNKFNDPFDSFIEFDFTGSPEEWKEHCLSKGHSLENANRIAKVIEGGESTIKNWFSSKLFHETSSTTLVTCFSTKPDNILLWSHYAKDHTGICIGFKIYQVQTAIFILLKPTDLNKFHNDIPAGAIPLVKVKYSAEMPQSYNPRICDQTRTVEFVKTKSEDWAYEDEYRALIASNMVINNPVHFDPTHITDIIFGINTDEADIQKVKGIISTYPSSGDWIKLFKCERAKGKYEIKLVPI